MIFVSDFFIFKMRGRFKLLLVAVILGVGLAEVKVDLIFFVSKVFHGENLFMSQCICN